MNGLTPELGLAVHADSVKLSEGKTVTWHAFSKSKGEAGFSLIEILVAFTILAIALGVLLNIFSGGLRAAIVSEEYQQALAIAESQLARVGVEIILEDGAVQGVDQGKFYWSMQGSPFELPQAKNGVEQQAMQIKAYKVQVKVEWEEGRENRIVVLNSLRLAKVKP